MQKLKKFIVIINNNFSNIITGINKSTVRSIKNIMSQIVDFQYLFENIKNF